MGQYYSKCKKIAYVNDSGRNFRNEKNRDQAVAWSILS